MKNPKPEQTAVNDSGTELDSDAPLTHGCSPTVPEWQPIETEPSDGDYRLYGLHVRGIGDEWLEIHYLAWGDGGNMIDAAGDYFSEWSHSDFEFWAPAPEQKHGR
jgi:hypothetical protein